MGQSLLLFTLVWFLPCSFTWINKGFSDYGPVGSSDAPEHSYLLAVTYSNDLKIFEIGHKPFLYGDGEEVKDNKMALLPLKLMSSMSHKKISSLLSKAQLSTTVETLLLLGSSEGGNVIILANGDSIIRFNVNSSSYDLMLSAIFSVNPDMSVFEDDLLPQYVGKLTCDQVVWPLLFTLTEDGIILVYNLTSTKCICAINPVEYCKLFYPSLLESETILKQVSSSVFLSLVVSPDLMKVAIFTSNHYTILVNLPGYFKHFPNYYPKVVITKSPHRSSHSKVSFQASRAALEEDEDLHKYGGLTKRQKALGTTHHGRFVGQFATQKAKARLKERVKSYDFSSSQGLNLDSIISMEDSKGSDSKGSNSKSSQDTSLKWYEQTPTGHVERKTELHDSQKKVSSSCSPRPVSSFGRRGSITPSIPSSKVHSRKPSYINQTSNWRSFPYVCILPPPDITVSTTDSSTTAAADVLDLLSVGSSHDCVKRSLVHMDCSSSKVTAYYCNSDYQFLEHGTV